MTPAELLQHIRLKRELTNWRIFSIFAILLALMFFYSSNNTQSRPSLIRDFNHIARIKIEGPIYYDDYAISQIKAIEKNKSIKAVVMHINSPGGTIVGGESYYNALRKLAESKPLVAVMEDAAASGGYMTAIAADYIVAFQGTITGSIGVISQSYEATDLAQKIGLQFHHFKSSNLKGGPLPTEKMTPEMRQSMDALIKDMYEMFFKMVSLRRHIAPEKLRQIADGRAYTGNQALHLGLIDAIGDEEAAINWLKRTKKINPSLDVIDYDLVEKDSPVADFFDMAKILQSFGLELAGNKATLYFK